MNDTESMRYGHHITIDDACPVFEARIETLPAVLAAHRRVMVTGNVRAGDGLVTGRHMGASP